MTQQIYSASRELSRTILRIVQSFSLRRISESGASRPKPLPKLSHRGKMALSRSSIYVYMRYPQQSILVKSNSLGTRHSLPMLYSQGIRTSLPTMSKSVVIILQTCVTIYTTFRKNTRKMFKKRKLSYIFSTLARTSSKVKSRISLPLLKTTSSSSCRTLNILS